MSKAPMTIKRAKQRIRTLERAGERKDRTIQQLQKELAAAQRCIESFKGLNFDRRQPEGAKRKLRDNLKAVEGERWAPC